MRTKKTKTGVTYVYNRKKDESKFEALEREFKSSSNKYKEFSNNSKNFYLECIRPYNDLLNQLKSMVNIIDFVTIDNEDANKIINGDALHYLGLPITLDELLSNYPDGYDMSIPFRIDKYTSSDSYEILFISIRNRLYHNEINGYYNLIHMSIEKGNTKYINSKLSTLYCNDVSPDDYNILIKEIREHAKIFAGISIKES